MVMGIRLSLSLSLSLSVRVSASMGVGRGASEGGVKGYRISYILAIRQFHKCMTTYLDWRPDIWPSIRFPRARAFTPPELNIEQRVTGALEKLKAGKTPARDAAIIFPPTPRRHHPAPAATTACTRSFVRQVPFLVFSLTLLRTRAQPANLELSPLDARLLMSFCFDLSLSYRPLALTISLSHTY
jgi:hypothetical protein